VFKVKEGEMDTTKEFWKMCGKRDLARDREVVFPETDTKVKDMTKLGLMHACAMLLEEVTGKN